MALPGRLAADTAALANAAETAECIKQEVFKILEALSNFEYDPEEYHKKVMDRQGWTLDESDPDEE